MDSPEQDTPTAMMVRRRNRRTRTVAVTAVVAGLALGGGVAHASAGSAPAAAAPQWSPGTSGAATDWTPSDHGRIVPGGGAATSAGTQTLTAATSAQERGVVDIDVVLGGTQRAAGTGMVLTANGEVLTNRHVVEGETSISVTVTATGRTYSARVVGISTTTDVAVVQLADASGLTTVTPSSAAAAVGDAVVGVGNAGGTGGTPSAAPGTVTAVGRSITASDDDGSNPEQLSGLIETDAAIQPGDSGGPLEDASNAVVGMDTAGSAGSNDGYAIPIATALSVARQIEAGGAGTQAGPGTAASSGQEHGHLGVEVQDGTDGTDGALVAGVVQGSAAAAAGITSGDTITSVAGHQVGSTAGLAQIMGSLPVGQRVAVTWVDQDGATHGARMTLG